MTARLSVRVVRTLFLRLTKPTGNRSTPKAITASRIPGSGIAGGDTAEVGCGRGGIAGSGIAGAGSFDGSVRPGLAFVAAHAAAGFARGPSAWPAVVQGGAVPAVSTGAAIQAAPFAARAPCFVQLSRERQPMSGSAKRA